MLKFLVGEGHDVAAGEQVGQGGVLVVGGIGEAHGWEDGGGDGDDATLVDAQRDDECQEGDARVEDGHQFFHVRDDDDVVKQPKSAGKQCTYQCGSNEYTIRFAPGHPDGEGHKGGEKQRDCGQVSDGNAEPLINVCHKLVGDYAYNRCHNADNDAAYYGVPKRIHGEPNAEMVGDFGRNQQRDSIDYQEKQPEGEDCDGEADDPQYLSHGGLDHTQYGPGEEEDDVIIVVPVADQRLWGHGQIDARHKIDGAPQREGERDDSDC